MNIFDLPALPSSEELTTILSQNNNVLNGLATRHAFGCACSIYEYMNKGNAKISITFTRIFHGIEYDRTTMKKERVTF